MPGSQNSSFIPKHTPTKAERKKTPRQLFIGTLIVRILFFAVLIASVGAFAYERRLSNQLDIEIAAFKAAVGSYEADEVRLQEVLNTDKRLAQAADKLSTSISALALLRAFESATINTVQISSLNLIRTIDEGIKVEAEILTDSFDSVLFQRSILQENEVLKNVALSDVTVTTIQPDDIESGDVRSGITFTAEINVEPEVIPFVPSETQAILTRPSTSGVAPAVEVGISGGGEVVSPEPEVEPSNQSGI